MIINGVDYPMEFTARAISNISRKFGGIQSLGEKLSNVDNFDDLIFVIWALIDAGVRYERINGREAPDALDYDDLLDLFCFDDFVKLTNEATTTITKGTAREIVAKPPKVKGKNAKATQGK